MTVFEASCNIKITNRSTFSLQQKFLDSEDDPKAEFYPYTCGFADEVGVGEGRGYNINIPWPRPKRSDADYMALFETVIEPVLDSFDPDFVIVSAGFDAVLGDPLGNCCVTPAGYAHMTRKLMRYAEGESANEFGAFTCLPCPDSWGCNYLLTKISREHLRCHATKINRKLSVTPLRSAADCIGRRLQPTADRGQRHQVRQSPAGRPAAGNGEHQHHNGGQCA